MPVRYLLLADDDTYVCRGWDALFDRLVCARGDGYTSASASVLWLGERSAVDPV